MNQKTDEESKDFYEPLKQLEGLKTVLECGSDKQRIIVLVEGSKYLEEFEDKVDEINESRECEVLTVEKWFQRLIGADAETLSYSRTSKPLLDPEGFHETLKEIVKEVEPDSTSRRAGELYGDADGRLGQAGDKLKRQIVEQTIQEVYRAGNAYLRFSSRPAASPSQIASRLENELDEDMDFYRELLSARKGGLKAEEFDISKLEDDRDRALEVIDDMMFIFRNEVEKEQQRLRDEASDCVQSIYESAIEGGDEEHISEKFVSEFMKEKPLADHASTVRNSVETGRQLDEPLRELSEFIDAIYRNTDIDIEIPSSIEALVEYRRRVMERSDPTAIFLLTVKDFLVSSSVSVVVVNKGTGKDEPAKKITEEIREEYGFDIHVKTESVKDYWSEVYQSSSVTVQELDYASVMLDKDNLIRAMKNLERKGEFRSSPGWMREKFRENPLEIIQPEEKTKLDVLKNLNEAATGFGKSVLVHHGITTSRSSRIPENLRAQVGEKLEEEHIETVELAIEMYRDIEYDERNDITANDLEDLYGEVRELKKRTAELINVI